jgi:transposase-like protein
MAAQYRGPGSRSGGPNALTPEEKVAMTQLYEAGHGIRYIAKEVGRPYGTVQVWINKNLETRPAKPNYGLIERNEDFCALLREHHPEKEVPAMRDHAGTELGRG